jgi:hypothetical protein
VYLLAMRTADPARSSPTYYTLIDAVSAEDVFFRVTTNYPTSQGVTPKTPYFWNGNGDFLLKPLPAYLGTEETDHNA